MRPFPPRKLRALAGVQCIRGSRMSRAQVFQGHRVRGHRGTGGGVGAGGRRLSRQTPQLSLYARHVEATSEATGGALRHQCQPAAKGRTHRGQQARPRPETGGCRVQEDAVSRRKSHRGGPARPMRTLSRRLRKLEDHYRIGPETEFYRQLHKRIAAARRRLAEFEAREGLNPRDAGRAERADLSGLSIEEVLSRGRMRNAAG